VRRRLVVVAVVVADRRAAVGRRDLWDLRLSFMTETKSVS